MQIENVTFHHEGFFWRCWFNGIVGENDSNIWQFWYSKYNSALFSPHPNPWLVNKKEQFLILVHVTYKTGLDS